MSVASLPRRDILKSILATIPVALDWGAFPVAKAADKSADEFDAVVIGAGLGGLSCAAAFARQGFRPLVIEQHSKPGGYATTFERPGGFVFDVSLHSTSAEQSGGIWNVIPGMPEITGVEFVQLPYLYRAIFPGHDIRVEQKNLGGYLSTLHHLFPEEKDGIDALFEDMGAVAAEISRYSAAQGKVDMSRFPVEFPHLLRYSTHTWGEVMDSRIKNPKLQAMASVFWPYYGLPPSKLAAVYYAMPTMGYYNNGGYYPKGRSQSISNAMMRFIDARGGKVLLNTRVDRILTRQGVAIGVHTADGHQYEARAVVSNANAWDTFHTLMEPADVPGDYLARMDQYTPSLSTFLVFLGLKRDLLQENGIRDAEIFYEPAYDPEAGYNGALLADMTNPAFGLMLYDNACEECSPRGKNTLSIVALQGYDHWKPFEMDYWRGRKADYHKEKSRMAEALIRQVERTVLPGLSKAVEVKEIATPLTNVRFTGNYRGAASTDGTRL